MPEQANSEEARIKALLEDWADAVRRHDLPAILAHHDRDMVMFDLPPGNVFCFATSAFIRGFS